MHTIGVPDCVPARQREIVCKSEMMENEYF